MNHKKLIFTLIVVAGLSFTLGACYPRHNSPEERVAWVSERIAGYLDLNDLQKAKLDLLRDELIETSGALREDGRTTGEEILVILADNRMDRERALEVINYRLDTLRARAPELVNRFGDLYDSLDEEQQAEVRAPVEKQVARYTAYRAE